MKSHTIQEELKISNHVDDEEDEHVDEVLALVVQRQDLKACTEALKALDLCHEVFKTKPAPPSSGGAFFVPTKLQPTNVPSSPDGQAAFSLAGNTYAVQAVSTAFFSTRSRALPPPPEILIRRSFEGWATSLPPPVDREELAISLPRTYTLYGSMLLFPPSSFSHPVWRPVLSRGGMADLIAPLLEATGTTRAAVNAPIPLSSTSGANVLRSPSSLLPLAGDFGPEVVPDNPGEKEFGEAYWTSTRQNGLTQVWAPRWTMFSARNHREKTRVLERLREGRWGMEEGGYAVVDLYVGIGYFAFSYVAAGARCVLGWDLNPWSIEGARRGAGANRFSCVREWDGEGEVPGLMLWREDNGLAGERVRGLRGRLPRVRHVNCGLLPSSKGSWRTAVEVLDKSGGWVHVHENFGVEEMETKMEEVRGEIERLVREHEDWPEETKVTVEEVFKVKSYAPGVVHCVLDVHIDPAYSS